MPEDDTRDGLRVGGWVPPYSPGDGSAGPIRPTVQPALPSGSHPRDNFPRLRGAGTARPRLVLAAALCLACAATAAVAVALDAARAPEPVAAEFSFPSGAPQTWPALPPGLGASQVPVSVQPSPPASSASATPSAGHTSAARATTAPTRSAGARPTRTATTNPAPVSLSVGSTAGLAAADQTALRVRHRHHRGRLDRIADGEGADANFWIRSGLANHGCVSFESVNFPGYYLRHRNFQILLERIDNSELFRQDATFCPLTIRSGAALVLRSNNYPSHYVVADDQWLRIAETSAERATAFVPRAAL
ncbi:AbfB domain-containing protein [Actinoplanes sp. NPDC049802]|uniref:AbfB domain-containing protein n=1 Tax=Actinoplanes sp. NPDC049802 TaxID=3154742 RepID=UPI0033D12A23